MSVFGSYAEYYDVLYSDKDYEGEAGFVRTILADHSEPAKTILELGCGTGRHTLYFAREGCRVQSVDISEDMLRIARAFHANWSSELQDMVDFSRGDIRDIQLGKRFDAVVCLFHVLSYQSAEGDAKRAVQALARHLNPGCVCLFDFWYGPAVLSGLPQTRIKRAERADLKLIRIAEPRLRPSDNVVDVAYQLLVQRGAGTYAEEVCEVHSMRYFFRPELEDLLRSEGLTIVEFGEWETRREPSLNSWSAYIAARYEPSTAT